MQIDIVSSASPCGAPSTATPGASPEASDVPGSFAALLDEAAQEDGESTPADSGDEDDCPADEWAVITVAPPLFMEPVVPQDTNPWRGPAVAVEDEAVESDVISEIAEDKAPPVDTGVLVLPIVDVVPFVAVPAIGPEPTVPDQDPWVAPTQPVAALPTTSLEQPTAPPVPSTAGSERAKAAPDAVTPHAVDAGVVDARPASEDTRAPLASPAEERAWSAPDEKLRTAARISTAPKVVREDASQPQPDGDAVSATARAVEQLVANDSAQREMPTDVPRVEARQGHAGMAARLARALERATESSAVPVTDAPSGQSGQGFNQAGTGQQVMGEWLREQLTPLMAQGHQQASPTFSINVPLQNDARVSGLIATSGGQLIAGAPALPAEQDVASQLLHSLRMQFREGIGEAVLKLKPEHLGSVSISLRVENGGLQAKVQAEAPAVRQWLESHQDTLRNGLAEHGLRLDRFVVDPDGERQPSPRDAHGERSPRKRQARRAARVDQPVFEVVV